MRSLALFIFTLLCGFSPAQDRPKHPFYFSWGYNKEWYARNDIRISQPDLRNDYAFVNLKGSDKPGWNTGIFNKDLTIPQYNYRLGYCINSKWAAELNFDHTKYQVPDQWLHLVGTLGGRTVDSTFARTDSSLAYQLNNGANFFLFNAVRRFRIMNPDSAKVNIRLLCKGGLGFVYPHVQNTILGNDNTPDFQFGGFDVGGEAGLQANFFRRVYLEYTNKVVYAVYRNLDVYKGTAKQNLACYEMVLSLGVWF